MNEVAQQTFKPIRCGGHIATPYLRKYLSTLSEEYKYRLLVDLSCGNLKNSSRIGSYFEKNNCRSHGTIGESNV